MSIYTQCGEAARKLLEDPSLADSGVVGVFTEHDIVAVAAKSNWTQSDFRMAMREANAILTNLFTRGKVTRYGPVDLPGSNDPDYVRIAAKLAHAHPTEGPKAIKTPNGTFKRLPSHEASIRQGRRLGSNRDDLRPWDEQDISTLRAAAEQRTRQRPKPTTDLEAAHKEIATLKAEVHRLRRQLARREGTPARAS